MNRRRYVILVGLASIIAITAITGRFLDRKALSYATPTVVAAEGRILHARLLLSGVLAPSRSVEIRAEASGVVEEVFVVRGQRVNQGQLLARLRTDQALADLKEADLVVAETQLSLEKALIAIDNVSLSLAQANARRQHLLFKEGLVSRMVVEIADSEVHAAELGSRVRSIEVAAARKAVDRSRARREKAQAVLEATSMRAPFDGIVLRLPVSEGSSVSSLTQAVEGDRGAIVVASDEGVLLRAKATAGQLTQLEMGQLAEIRVQGSDRVLRGRVSFIPIAAELDSTGLPYFSVEIRISDVKIEDVLLNAEASAEVLADVPVHVGVPMNCVHYDDRGAAYVVDGVSGLRRSVQTRRADEAFVEVTRGLAPGDLLGNCDATEP